MEDPPEGIVADVVHKPHDGCGAVPSSRGRGRLKNHSHAGDVAASRLRHRAIRTASHKQLDTRPHFPLQP
jgi:hypothetical protein